MDLNNIPFIQAKRYQPTNPGRHIQYIVLHSMEAPEKGTTAESVANYFSNGSGGRAASAHYCVDNDSIVQCVQTKDVAYGAANANRNGIHIELAGYAKQSREEWLDPYSKSMLDLAAQLCAKVLVPKFKIPTEFLSENALRRSKEDTSIKGFTTHAMVNRAFGGTHWDPGPNFPEDVFLSLVRMHLESTTINEKPLEPSIWHQSPSGTETRIPGPLEMRNGETWVRLTDILPVLGHRAEWEPETKRVVIKQK